MKQASTKATTMQPITHQSVTGNPNASFSVPHSAVPRPNPTSIMNRNSAFVAPQRCEGELFTATDCATGMLTPRHTP